MITEDFNWAEGAVELDGVELTDKAELVGKPMLLTDVWFETGSNEINYVYAQGRLQDGTEFTINDSSTTGIKQQLTEHLAKTGQSPTPGEVVAVKILVARGLRVSQYEVSDKGRTKQAKTYYLTTSGKRESTEGATPARSRSRKSA